MIDYTEVNASELDEFRNALAVIGTLYEGDDGEYLLARRLVRDADSYIQALEAIASLLLHTLDVSGVSGNVLLDKFRASAAMASPGK